MSTPLAKSLEQTSKGSLQMFEALYSPLLSHQDKVEVLMEFLRMTGTMPAEEELLKEQFSNPEALKRVICLLDPSQPLHDLFGCNCIEKEHSTDCSVHKLEEMFMSSGALFYIDVDGFVLPDDLCSNPWDQACVDLTEEEEGGVVKYMITAGTGGRPLPYTRVTVHVDARVVNSNGSDTMIYSTRNMGKPIVADLGAEQASGEIASIRGLQLAIPCMRLRERSLIRCTSQYAGTPSKQESIKFVEFDVEVLSTSIRVDEMMYQLSKYSRGLTFAQRLAAAQEKKDEGNKFFKTGNAGVASALACYQEGLNILGYVDHKQKKECAQILQALMLNIAQCFLKRGSYAACVNVCDSVLTRLDSKCVKALFRRGKAYLSMRVLDNAEADLTDALKLAPDDDDVRRTLTDLDHLRLEHGEGCDCYKAPGKKAEKPEIKNKVDKENMKATANSSSDSSKRETKGSGKSEKKVVCGVCSREYPEGGWIGHSLRYHSPWGVVQCELCNREVQREEMAEHLTFKHPEVRVKSHKDIRWAENLPKARKKK